MSKIKVYGEIYDWGFYGNYLSQVERAKEYEELEIDINSPGGSVIDGLGFFDALQDFAAKGGKIKTRNMGLAASMASVIFLAGQKRIMRPNSFFMIHNPWVFAVGDADKLESQAELLRKMEDKIVAIYQKVSGLSATKIRNMMDAETWLTAEEAKVMGFATSIEQGETEALDIETGIAQSFYNVPAALVKTERPSIGVKFMQLIRATFLGDKLKQEAKEEAPTEAIDNQNSETDMKIEDVQALIDAKMSAIQADTEKIKAEVEAAKAEAATLKAENERLKAEAEQAKLEPVLQDAAVAGDAKQGGGLRLKGLSSFAKSYREARGY